MILVKSPERPVTVFSPLEGKSLIQERVSDYTGPQISNTNNLSLFLHNYLA